MLLARLGYPANWSLHSWTRSSQRVFSYEDRQNGARQRRFIFHLNRNAGVAVGLDLCSGEWRGLVTDLIIRILCRRIKPLTSNSLQATLDTLAGTHHSFFAEIGELVINPMRETAQRRSLPPCFEGVEITRGRPGADAPSIGVCGLVINRYNAGVEPAMQVSLH